MIPYLHLLVIGALLWNQNSIVAEDSSPPTTTTKKSGLATTFTVSSDLQAPISNRNDSRTNITSTSMSVLTTLSAPNNTDPDVTLSSMQTSILSNPANDTPPLSNASSIAPTTGPDTTQLTATVATTQDQQALECAKFKLQRKGYNNPELHLELVDEKKIESNRFLICNNKSESSPFVFQVLPCEYPDIICYVDNCTNPLTYNETQKPAENDFHLNVTTGSTSVTLTWNTILKHCEVRGEYNCSSDDGKYKWKHDSAVNPPILDSYSNYTCTANLFYGNHLIKNETRKIRTMIGTPKNVDDLVCEAINATAIKITWKDPKVLTGPPPLLFDIRVYSKFSFKVHNVSLRSYIASDLEPYTEYEIGVSAVQEDERNTFLYGSEKKTECKTEPGIVFGGPL
ncbi:receptor-type tyrosine-protein phosphatase C-like [Pelobates fuscus]|uniref:receptor-type tyrosine-protein phosphatase C-like n=1 Tax=Pelobates fuscus TaxID=191477 RepID=UPI002FE450CC